MFKQSDIQSVHYARNKYDALRTLAYDELLKDRTNGRWENKPELASKYVEDRKKTEQVYRDKLKAIGINVPDDQSFLYSTIPGREKFNPGKGYYQHNFNINDEDLKRTLFDVVGLPEKLLHPDGPQIGQAGYDDAIARWDKHKKILGKTKYMGMTIRPRIEVISPHGNTGYANLMKQSGWHIVYPDGRHIKKHELQPRPKDATPDNGDPYTPWYNKIEHAHIRDEPDNDNGLDHPWKGSIHIKAKDLQSALLRAKNYKPGMLKEANALMRALPKINKVFTPFQVAGKANKTRIETYLGQPGWNEQGFVSSTLPFKDVRSINNSNIAPELRGFGVGRKLYGTHIRDSYNKYVGGEPVRYITSDSTGSTSSAATNVWEALKRRFYPIIERATASPDMLTRMKDSKYMIDLEQMKNFYKDKTMLNHKIGMNKTAGSHKDILNKPMFKKPDMLKEAKTIIGDSPEGAPREGLTQYFLNHHGNDEVRALKVYRDYAAQDITGDYTFQKNIPNGILSLMGHGGGKTENYTLGDAVTAAARVPLSRILQEHTGKKPSLLEVLGCNGDGACIDKIIDKSPFKNVPRRTYGTPGHVSTTDTANAARNFAITQRRPWLIPTKEEFVRSANSTGIDSPSHTAEIRPVIPTSVSIPVGISLAAAGGLAGLYYWNKKRKKELENNMNKEAILRGLNKRAADILPMAPSFMSGLTNTIKAPEPIQTKILQFLQAAPTKQYKLTTPSAPQVMFNKVDKLKTNYTSWANNDGFADLKKSITDGLKNPNGPGETILNFNKALTNPNPKKPGELLLPHVLSNPANAGVSNLFHHAFQMAPNNNVQTVSK